MAQLREELRKLGVTRINGVPLGRVRREQLVAVFLAMREERDSFLGTRNAARSKERVGMTSERAPRNGERKGASE